MSSWCEISSLSTWELIGNSCNSQCLAATWPVGRMAAMPLKGVRWETGSRKLCRSWWISPGIFSPRPATGRNLGISSCPASVFTWLPAGFGLSHSTECLLLCGQKWHQWNTALGEFVCTDCPMPPPGFCCPLWSPLGKNSEFKADSGSIKLDGCEGWVCNFALDFLRQQSVKEGSWWHLRPEPQRVLPLQGPVLEEVWASPELSF